MATDAMSPLDLQPVTIRPENVPLVTRWGTDEEPLYVVELEDAHTAVLLTEQQIRGLSANILWSMLTMDEDFEESAA